MDSCLYEHDKKMTEEGDENDRIEDRSLKKY